MSIVAIIPVASLLAANQALQTKGFGLGNFSVPVWGATPSPAFAAFHSWTDPVFEAAVKLIPGAIIAQSNGDPVADTLALIATQGAQWGAQAPALPVGGDYPGHTHPVTASTLYRWTDGTMWWVIQAFDRAVYGGDPNQYPALIRQVRDPNTVVAWKQPLDQYDAYKLVNPFIGGPDKCLWTDGKVYATKIDNNTYSPAGYPAGWQVQP